MKPALNIYLIPGLGLSGSYFDSLRFPAGCRSIVLPLMQPVKNETIESYAARLLCQVEDGVDFILIGVSFGGVLAQAMAQIRAPLTIVLLSSILHSRQLPWYFRAGYSAGLSRLIPYSLVSRLIDRIRIATGKENQGLYDRSTIMAGFLSWSLTTIVTWKPSDHAVPVVQIHGSDDRLLPCRKTKNNIVIRGARHLLLPAKSPEVNAIVGSIISRLREQMSPAR